MTERLPFLGRLLRSEHRAPVGVGEQQIKAVCADPNQPPALYDRASPPGPAGAPQYDTGVVVRGAIMTAGHPSAQHVVRSADRHDVQQRPSRSVGRMTDVAHCHAVCCQESAESLSWGVGSTLELAAVQIAGNY